MIPLASLTEVVPTVGHSSLNHYALQRSQKFTASLAPGASHGDVLPRVEEIVRSSLPAGFSLDYGGVSREFVESSGAILVTFGISLLVIYLVLAAQFESFVHPLTVMLSVPLACLGALATLLALGHTLNIYSQTGIILLVGLVTKIAILLVDFANHGLRAGKPLREALLEAGQVRLRPIMMTTMAMIFGMLPMSLGLGESGEMQAPMGRAVMGGLITSALLTLVVVPVLFTYLHTFGESVKAWLRHDEVEEISKPKSGAPAASGALRYRRHD